MKEVLNDDYVAGGITAANGRAWVDGIAQVFGDNPVADMYYEGGFVGGIATGQVNKALEPGKTIDWTDFPSLGGPDANPVTIGGDVIAALTDKPCVKEFITFMTTADSGTAWAETGAIISPIKAVSTDAYPTDLVKREAAQVTGASVVKFDGSDLLPAGSPDLGAELQKAIAGSDRGLGQLRDPGEDRLGQRVALTEPSAGGPPGLPHLRPARQEDRPLARATSAIRSSRPPRRTLEARPRRARRTTGAACFIFFGPAAVLLLVFLVFPTIYTILLAFNRGRRGEFTQWVGLDNFTTLFTNDPNFINLSTFPPSGAVWNNVLWIIFYTGFVLGLGLIIATLASRVRYESIIKAAVFLPQAIAATALAVIWKFVYAPDSNIGLLNAVLGVGERRTDLVPG